MAWTKEGNGLTWRFKNGGHPTKEGVWNRIEMILPGTEKVRSIALGLNLTDAQKREAAAQCISDVQAKLGYFPVVTAETAKSLADLWTGYEKEKLAQGHKASQRNKAIFTQHVLRILGGYPLAQVNNRQYGLDYMIKRRMEKASEGTIAREFVVINAVLNVAVSNQIITANHLGNVKVPKGARREVVIPLDVIHEIMLYANRPLKRAIILALCTAQRQEKICEMSPANVFMHEDKAVGRMLTQSPARTVNKYNLGEIPLSDLAYAALTDGMPQIYPAHQRALSNWASAHELGHAFADARDRALEKGTLYRAFLRRKKLDGITFHDLRHTSNSMLQTRTEIDSAAGKKLLGHSGGVHDRYSHQWEWKLRQAVDALADIYRPLADSLGYSTKASMIVTSAQLPPMLNQAAR